MTHLLRLAVVIVLAGAAMTGRLRTYVSERSPDRGDSPVSTAIIVAAIAVVAIAVAAAIASAADFYTNKIPGHAPANPAP